MLVDISLCQLIFNYDSCYFIRSLDISFCHLMFIMLVDRYFIMPFRIMPTSRAYVIWFMTLSNTFLAHRRNFYFQSGNTPANFAKK